MGRRNSRGDCARRGRGFSFIGRRAAAAQRERHSDSLSSKSLVGPQTQCKRDRAKSSRAASRVKFMPQVPIIMPQLGESIAEATIVDIKVKPGDEVADDQEILDVETNKAVMGVTIMSPRIRARMAELQLTTADLAGIMGTGAGNRVTIKDLENFLHKIESQMAQDASAIRTGVADAMRRSWMRPLSTIGSSVNLDPVLQDRQSRDPKPGPGLYALRALALALAETPGAAAKLIGNRVVQSTSIDVGIAVEAEDGIMVPVIRSAEKTSLADLATKYKELIELARQRRISPDMQAGGIATVSNFGTFGTEWGTPIPLPDQTLLLGLGAGKKVPSWDENKKQFVPKTEAQITLSFDHRSIDGGGAGRLLKRVIELLEDPKKL